MKLLAIGIILLLFIWIFGELYMACKHNKNNMDPKWFKKWGYKYFVNKWKIGGKK